MKLPGFIEEKDWSRLTAKQKRIMKEKGPVHLRVMHGWLKGKSQQPRSGEKPRNLPRSSQWFCDPEDSPREKKDHQY